jgi:hypothetical protein
VYENAKMIPVQTIPGIRREGYEGELWRGRIQL